MRIAVLGGGGFIGCNLISYLKDKGHWVRSVDLDYPEYREEMWNKADEVIDADLRIYKNMDLATRNVDWVVQLAADMGGVGFFHGGHDYYPYLHSHQINLNALKACEKNVVKRMFFSASACVYPTHLNMTSESPELTEEMIYPANCDMSYGWEKLMMLRLCERAPFDARVGIFDTIYGVYQEKSGDRMKFPTSIATKVIKAKRSGEPVEVWGDGSQQRVFLYITDALEKIYAILANDEYFGPVNVASDTEVTIKGIAEMCCDIVGIPQNIIYDTTKPVGVLSRRTSNQKWNNCYGFQPKVTPRQGFEEMITWLSQEVI
jgi:nucleoside-diphosphate-sugar epimerase